MKCSTCGFPLSPSRSSCPRCGTAYGASPRNAQPEPESFSIPQRPFSPVNEPAGYPQSYASEQDGQRVQRDFAFPAPPWQPQHAPSSHNDQTLSIEQLPFPEAENGQAPLPKAQHDPVVSFSNAQNGQAPFPSAQTYQSAFPYGGGGQTPNSVPNWQAPPTTTPTGLSTPPPQYAPYASSGIEPRPSGMARTTRVGLTVSSLCVIAGALILLFVAIMAQGLPARTAIIGLQPTETTLPAVTPTPTIVISPTPTQELMPGQQYIDNGRMASTVFEDSGLATQYATEFKIAQKVYVTFTVHSGMEAGAVCLSWYVNGEYDNHYEFAVKQNAAYDAYSYAWFHKTGQGYVELAWASSTDCTDKLLAQRVPFTITA